MYAPLTSYNPHNLEGLDPIIALTTTTSLGLHSGVENIMMETVFVFCPLTIVRTNGWRHFFSIGEWISLPSQAPLEEGVMIELGDGYSASVPTEHTHLLRSVKILSDHGTLAIDKLEFRVNAEGSFSLRIQLRVAVNGAPIVTEREGEDEDTRMNLLEHFGVVAEEACAGLYKQALEEEKVKKEKAVGAASMRLVYSTLSASASPPQSVEERSTTTLSSFERLAPEMKGILSSYLSAMSVYNLSRASTALHAEFDQLVIGLNAPAYMKAGEFSLFDHQFNGLHRILRMEDRGGGGGTRLLRIPIYRKNVDEDCESGVGSDWKAYGEVWAELETGAFHKTPPHRYLDEDIIKGGFLCDEPGLGKTITVLALVLRSKGRYPCLPSEKDEADRFEIAEKQWATRSIYKEKGVLSLLTWLRRRDHDELFHTEMSEETLQRLGMSDFKNFAKHWPPLDFWSSLPVFKAAGARSLKDLYACIKSVFANAIAYHTASGATGAKLEVAKEAEKLSAAFDGQWSQLISELAPPDPKVARLRRLIPSSATLIVVPPPLVTHWKSQFMLYSNPSFLGRAYYDEPSSSKRGSQPLPLPGVQELAKYDVVVTTYARLSKECRKEDGSSLSKIHWQRLVFDEGHALGKSSCTNQVSMALDIEAERRWCITGTPTPDTTAEAAIKHIEHLLKFVRAHHILRDWRTRIQRPFLAKDPKGFGLLGSILADVMIRHTKSDLKNALPDPIITLTELDMSTEERNAYNSIVTFAQTNVLLTAELKGQTSGWEDSILNPRRRKDASNLLGNIKQACCGGARFSFGITSQAQEETLNMLEDIHHIKLDGDTPSEQFLRAVRAGELSVCQNCGQELQLLLITTCAHLVCVPCFKAHNLDTDIISSSAISEENEQNIKPVKPAKKPKHWEIVSQYAKKASNNYSNTSKSAEAPRELDDKLRIHTCTCPIESCNKEIIIDDLQRLQPGVALRWSWAVKTTPLPLPEAPAMQLLLGLDGGPIPQGEVAPLNVPQEWIFEEGQRWKREKTSHSKATEIIKVIEEARDRRTAAANELIYGRINCKSGGVKGTMSKDTRPVKAIVFSQYRKVLDVVGDKIIRHFGNYPTPGWLERGDGHVADFFGDRDKELYRFRHSDDCFVMLLTSTGSHGLDLSFVTHIFLVNRITDKAVESQIVARAHRLGAKGPVHVIHLVMKGTIEEDYDRVAVKDMAAADSNSSSRSVRLGKRKASEVEKSSASTLLPSTVHPFIARKPQPLDAILKNVALVRPPLDMKRSSDVVEHAQDTDDTPNVTGSSSVAHDAYDRQGGEGGMSSKDKGKAVSRQQNYDAGGSSSGSNSVVPQKNEGAGSSSGSGGNHVINDDGIDAMHVHMNNETGAGGSSLVHTVHGGGEKPKKRRVVFADEA